MIIAGMFETGFAFCLGKMKETAGTEHWAWCAGFIVSLTLSMVLLAKAVHTIPDRHGLPCMDGHRSRWNGCGGHHIFQGTGNILATVFHHNAHNKHYRTEAGALS